MPRGSSTGGFWSCCVSNGLYSEAMFNSSALVSRGCSTRIGCHNHRHIIVSVPLALSMSITGRPRRRDSMAMLMPSLAWSQ